ncbi:FkbM family methyltransferase [Azospirillum humicireducens]|nr:FkbM family methyltransferase [Azospirillum humicireducens]
MTEFAGDFEALFDGAMTRYAFERPSIARWWESHCSEPNVNIALQELVQPGDTCFDVGSFIGGLAIIMARLTGPRGKVVLFEGNQHILSQLTWNMIRSHLTNTFIVNKIIWEESDLNMYLSHNSIAPAASRVCSDEASDPHAIRVGRSLALDDFVAEHSMLPDVVKMDIEGSEYYALRGFKKTISEKKPVLILEQNVGDDRCLELLSDMDYKIFDSAGLHAVRSSNDYLEGTTIRNVIAIHASALGRYNLHNPVQKRKICSLDPLKAEVEVDSQGVVYSTFRMKLSRGRYLFVLSLDAKDCVVASEIWVNGTIQTKFYETAKLFSQDCRDMMALVHKDCEVVYKVLQVQKSSENGYMKINSVDIISIDAPLNFKSRSTLV